MLRAALLAAVATGGFCAVFALGIDAVTEALTWRQVAIVSFLSGFLGSLFARLVLGRRGAGE